MKGLVNSLYGIGVSILIVLIGHALFGANLVPNPDAMIPYSMRDIAFAGLAVGTLPMGLAAWAVYKRNGFAQSKHKKRVFLLVFLPCFICGGCLLGLLGIFAVGLVQAIGFSL